MEINVPVVHSCEAAVTQRRLPGDPLEEQARVNSYFRASAPYWKEIYERQTLHAQLYQQRRLAALSQVQQLQLARRSPVLEVGCGPGLTTVALAQMGYQVEAIDTVQEMLSTTRRALEQEEVVAWATTSIGDIQRLNYQPNSFELVLVIGVLEWLRTLDQPMREISRVLRPDGCLIASADNSWAIHRMVDPWLNPLVTALKRSAGKALRRLRLRRPRPRTRTHSIRQVDAALTAAGLEKVRGLTLGFGPFSLFNRPVLPDSLGLPLHRKLQQLADRGLPFIRSAGLTYLVVARKP